ncbi:putative trehalase [Dorcoceras hygrometricum]|uniref:Putative trehalase n=1 Tax=Dorcoceras hygrometricum TaxID=472368 RepID=A0A2Z7BSQ6_9LAMI|nr:putative trehalase [Dorcoceras hygrometricum]
MASSYISNALQINFDSVFKIQDNDDMVNMFRALEATGLGGFLGCSSVLYEQELEQFFDTALIQDGDITCAVSGKYVAISPRIQLAVGPQPLWLRNHNSGLAYRIMVKRLATSPHDPLGVTDSACKNQLVVVSVQYGPFNPYIPIINDHCIGYPRMSASGESSTTMHRLLHASGSHPIPTPYDPKTNQYNQDLGLVHSTNGNHLESPKEGSSIDHQVTIYLHAQNITMFPTNETWYFASQILVSNSGGLILILTAQSTRNMFRIHSDY